jgi:ankyrin repeat protein
MGIGKLIQKILFHRHADIRIRDHQKKTALIAAMSRGHVAMVELLLVHHNNADLEILDVDRRNVIHHAVKSEDPQILKVSEQLL